MALPRRRFATVLNVSYAGSRSLVLLLPLSLSLSVCLSIPLSSSLSRSHLFRPLPLTEPPDLRFLLVVLVLVLHHLLPHLFTFPLSLRSASLSLPPYLLPPSLIHTLSLPLSPSFIFLSSSRNPTTSSLHDLVVGWRPSLVLPTSYSSVCRCSHLTRWRWEEEKEDEEVEASR